MNKKNSQLKFVKAMNVVGEHNSVYEALNIFSHIQLLSILIHRQLLLLKCPFFSVIYMYIYIYNETAKCLLFV